MDNPEPKKDEEAIQEKFSYQPFEDEPEQEEKKEYNYSYD